MKSRMSRAVVQLFKEESDGKLPTEMSYASHGMFGYCLELLSIKSINMRLPD
jgi:hypothetical protein